MCRSTDPKPLLKNHIDLIGRSGAAYRFRLAPDPTALPAEGGNFVYVRGHDPVEVVYSAAADTLHDASRRWEEARLEHGAEAIYVRLNITRALREREHNDVSLASTGSMT